MVASPALSARTKALTHVDNIANVYAISLVLGLIHPHVATGALVSWAIFRIAFVSPSLLLSLCMLTPSRARCAPKRRPTSTTSRASTPLPSSSASRIRVLPRVPSHHGPSPALRAPNR
ncbi:hypothetical protein DFH09DRAFT_211581 [Mycena vulgaris]|nr:hypothetical protein DFH09DRAFT_211581 [Mycena vulgaris]